MQSVDDEMLFIQVTTDAIAKCESMAFIKPRVVIKQAYVLLSDLEAFKNDHSH